MFSENMEVGRFHTFFEELQFCNKICSEAYFCSEAYPEPCQTSKMECFEKIVNVTYFHKTLHLRCLKGFSVRLSFVPHYLR